MALLPALYARASLKAPRRRPQVACRVLLPALYARASLKARRRAADGADGTLLPALYARASLKDRRGKHRHNAAIHYFPRFMRGPH